MVLPRHLTVAIIFIALVLSVFTIPISANDDKLSPTIVQVPKCTGDSPTQKYWLTNVPDGQYVDPINKTILSLCWNDAGISVTEFAQGKYIHSNSTKCNDPVWEHGSALELFISRVSSPDDVPIEYYEIDSTPSGVVFATLIQNQKGTTTTCPNCTIGPLPCTGTSSFTQHPNLIHNIQVQDGEWWSTVRLIPFSIFDNFIAPSDPEIKNRLFRFNTYRYDYPNGFHQGYQLSGSQPTWSPSFHVPQRFALMVLVDEL